MDGQRQLITLGAVTLAALTVLLIADLPAQAQTETVIYSFCTVAFCPDGFAPVSRLTPDGKGNLFGTTIYGALGYPQNNGYGTVFELSPNGSGGWNETTLYSFTGGTDGGTPYANVIFDGSGNLYGTAFVGGDSTCNPPPGGCGVVYKLTPSGGSWTETVLHSFTGGTDGGYPVSGLTLDPAGNLYGTNYMGADLNGLEEVFELSPSSGGWTVQAIYSGAGGDLLMDSPGNIYFVAQSGAVFELSPNGSGGWNSKVIHTFTSENFANYVSLTGCPLTFDQAGNLYGTRTRGGTGSFGVVYELSPLRNGKWKKSDLYSFPGSEAFPWGGVAFDGVGNIYGVTIGADAISTPHGNFGAGSVYELMPSGGGSYQEKDLWNFSFSNPQNGLYPLGGVILDNSGNLYGTTYAGGSSLAGAIFQVTP